MLHRNFNNNSATNPKIGFKIFLPKNDKILAHFRALKSIFEFNVYIGYFGRSHRIITAAPHGCARKLRLTRPSVPSVLVK